MQRERLREARTALHGIMGCEEVLAIAPPLLVVSNKIDRNMHMSEVDIIEGTVWCSLQGRQDGVRCVLTRPTL